MDQPVPPPMFRPPDDLAPINHPEISVGKIIRREILECGPDVPLFEAAQRMSLAHVSSILVTEANEVLGIWTERDALAVDFDAPASFMRPVREVMSTPVLSVPASLGLQELTARFRDEHVRHYLVVDTDGARLGIVSQTDVVLNQGIEHYLRMRKLDTIIKGRLHPLAPDASLAEAARHMREHGCDAVVVGYKNEYGILTERDVTRLVAARAENAPIGDVASRPLLTVSEHASLYHVRCLLSDEGVRHIGVTRDDGTLCDLVSFSDILSGMELAYVHELRYALRQRDEALHTSRQNLHLAEKVIESSLDGILITDADARIISVNPAFTRLTGYRAQDVLGKTPAVLSSGRHDAAFYAQMWSCLRSNGYWQGEVWNRRKNGELYPELLTITAITDEAGDLTHYAALFSDISQLKENETRIRDLAYFDPLTRLPNRRLLDDRLQVSLAHAHRNSSRIAVMFIDLDRFKRINDSLGHEIGDRLLVEVAQRLRQCVREDDTVARMGGDEFVVILNNLADPDDAAHTATRIIEALRAPVIIDGRELITTTSIGISVYPEDSREPAQLIKNADIAMYRAKNDGRDSFQLYQPTMNARSLEHLALETALHRAIERNELTLHYQPVVRVADGHTIGVEALLRWQHPDLGLVPPGEFIPLAEESGLIVPIGAWVLRNACIQHRRWRERGLAPLQLMVNISVRQFRRDDFFDEVVHVLTETGMQPERLTLEVTETLLMETGDNSITVLGKLRALGIRIAIDDFGTGYSSLAYLKRFPIDELKIDRLFLRDIPASPRDSEIAAAIVMLGRSLNLRVIAEGVETAEQLALLRKNDCDMAQGFHFSPAVPAEQMELRLSRT